MNSDFGGRTRLAGNVRTGIRWPLAEWLGTRGGLVFCLNEERQELADELQQLRTTAQVIELSNFLREPARNVSAHIAREPEGAREWTERVPSSAVIRAGRRVQLFEDWWRDVDRSRLRSVFMTHKPEVESPADLIEEAVAELTHLDACGICEARSPAQPATIGHGLNLKTVDPGRQMIKRQEESYLARAPLELASSRLARLVAFLIRPVH